MFEAARREGGATSLPISPDGPLREFSDWAAVGLRADPLGSGRLVSAVPWCPAWGCVIPENGLEGYAAGERPKPFAAELACEGDPFLATLEHTTYQSVGQRAAVRASLTTPAGGTLAISLATGEGKSLIFQLAAKVGFASDDEPSGGLVVVVVPTVALAIDHENAAVRKGFESPIAYRGGDSVSNQALMDRLRADMQSPVRRVPRSDLRPIEEHS